MKRERDGYDSFCKFQKHAENGGANLRTSDMKLIVVALTLLAFFPGLGKAQKRAEHGLPVVYNDVSAGVAAIDRDARKAYAGKFRIVEVTERDGFMAGRMKAMSDRFADPRSMRQKKVPGKIVFLFVVTADGRAVEPRVLQSSHPRASDSLVSTLLVLRFVPARLRGVAVASVRSVEMNLKVEEMGPNQTANDGLGLPGYRDR